MRRIALALAAAVLGTGCVVTTDDAPRCDDPGTLSVYWTFVRPTLDGTKTYGCADGDVADVDVYVDDVLVYAGPCAGPNAMEGTGVQNVGAGTHYVTVYGYDADGVYTFGVADEVVLGQTCETLALAPYANPLVSPVSMTYGGTTYHSCATADIDWFDYTIWDFAGWPIETGWAWCEDVYAGGAWWPSFNLGYVDQGLVTMSVNAMRDVAVDTSVVIYGACDGQISHESSGPGATDYAPVTATYGTTCAL